MRNLRNPQHERGEVRIEDIKLNLKSRDDIPALLIGLQFLHSRAASRDRLFALMDEFRFQEFSYGACSPKLALVVPRW